MNKNLLPDKKIIAFLLVPIVALMIFFIIKDAKFFEEKKSGEGVILIKKEIDRKLEKDTDKDGLFDWQERLHGTDINKKDTDGDEISDFLEVKSGTDPLDILNSKKEEEIEDITKKYPYLFDKKLSITEKLARDIVVKALEYKIKNPNGDVLNEELVNNIVNDSLNQENNLELNIYTIKDLSVGENYPKELFFEEFILVKEGKNDKTFNEIKVLNEYLEKEDVSVLRKLSNNSKVYDGFVEKFLKIKAPKEIGNEYVNYINSLKNISIILKKLSNVNNDSVGLLTNTNFLKEALINFSESFLNLRLVYNSL